MSTNYNLKCRKKSIYCHLVDNFLRSFEIFLINIPLEKLYYQIHDKREASQKLFTRQQCSNAIVHEKPVEKFLKHILVVSFAT